MKNDYGSLLEDWLPIESVYRISCILYLVSFLLYSNFKIYKTPEILFEDNHILVVVKPVNMPVQPDSSNDPDLLNYLKNFLKEKYSKPGNAYLGLLHRLDRNVSGVMVLAKTSKAAARISEQIRDGRFHKFYRALVRGKISENGELVHYLYKNEIEKKAIVSEIEKAEYKISKLKYTLISYIEHNDVSLVDIELITGRFHQIRAQFSFIKHPIVGDIKYGDHEQLDYIFLQAYKINFFHPILNNLLTFEI